ncbi:MAG: response regulator [Chthoniobacter sp.]|nr:response regulator [Chthoniobacter sp.]
MTDPLRILLLEDSPTDEELVGRALARGGIEATMQRVQTEADFRAVLTGTSPQVVLADYNVPGFRGDTALQIARAVAPELPVIFVSGTIGEELAVELVKNGATDYVLKDRLERLPFAIRRALDEAEQRAARRRAEQAERRGAETLTVALEASQMGTWDWNVSTGELEWSDRCKALFGIPVDEPMNYGRFLRAVHLDDRSRTDAAIIHSLAEKLPHDLEYRAVWPDGTVHWIAAKGRAFYDESSGRPVRMAGTAMDITARKLAEEQRKLAEGKMQETQRLESIGVLAGGVAHDFNNLLTGVIGNTSLALNDLPKSSPLYPCLEQIEEAAQRAAELCRQMLAYAGKGQFVVQNVELSGLVRETTQLLESSIAKGVILQMDLATDLPAVRADITQLRQVVMNLVLNASEAIIGGGTVRVATGLRLADSAEPAVPDLPVGDYVFLEVLDTGRGMTPETLAKIFDPFFTTKFTGRGLGLAAVQGIIRGHHGCLNVSSTPDHGTTFQVFLPCVGARPHRPRTAPTDAAGWRGSGTVLVVDDEAVMRVVAGRMLEKMGFRVVFAEDGLQAVERFRAECDSIRAVLLDLTMPHLDGAGTFRELRQLRPEVPVLLMSGYNEQEAIRGFLGLGLAGFLQKPFTAADLGARMKEILR